MSIRAAFVLFASLGLSSATARCDRAQERRPDDPAPEVPAAAMSASGPPIDKLTAADELSVRRNVRLLGLTEPQKDRPYLRLRNTHLPLHGNFDQALWAHHDRLVIVEGLLAWEPVREVPARDEDGMAIQTRSRAGGFSMSRVMVRSPALADLAGRRAWVEGAAVPGPSIRAPEGEVKVEGRDVFLDSLQGRPIRADGMIERRGERFVIIADASYPVDLAWRVDSDVEIAGRCWSLNDAWWFSYRGEHIEVEAVSGAWPPRHLPGGGHGELARVLGRLRLSAKGNGAKYVITPRAVRPLGEAEMLDAAW